MTPCQRCGSRATHERDGVNFVARCYRIVDEHHQSDCIQAHLCEACLERVWFACALALRAVGDTRPIASRDMPEGTPVETRTLCIMGEVAYPNEQAGG